MKRHILWFLIGLSVLFTFTCGDDSSDTNGSDASYTPPENQAGSGIDNTNKNASADSGTVTETSVADSSSVDIPSSEAAVADGSVSEASVADTAVSDVLGSDADDSQTSFQGYEEFYIMTNEDDPVDVCRVRYELNAVEEPATACVECVWDVVVERSNPSVVTDVDDACANSELALDAASIVAKEGTRVAYGFVHEFVGHEYVLMRFDDDLGTWEAVTNASWDEETGDFTYDRRDGFCGYGGSGAAFESSGICGLSGEAVVKD